MILIQAKFKPDEVFFILNGIVLNEFTSRTFSSGAIIGETDFIYKRVNMMSIMIIIGETRSVCGNE